MKPLLRLKAPFNRRCSKWPILFLSLLLWSQCGSNHHAPNSGSFKTTSELPENGMNRVLAMPGGQSSFKVVTFNMRNFGADDKAAKKSERQEKLSAFVDQHFSGVDVLAVQEIVDKEALEDLLAPRFHCHGFANEWTGIHFVMICLRHGLSFKQTPSDDNFLIEKVAHGYLRPAVHGIIASEAGRKEYFYLVAVHLKAGNQANDVTTRLRQANFLADALEQAPNNLPYIVTGDFNTYKDDLQIMSDAFAGKVPDLEYASNTLEKTHLSGQKFDHFWISSILRVQAQANITATDPCNGFIPKADYFAFKDYISDHCPIFLNLHIKD